MKEPFWACGVSLQKRDLLAATVKMNVEEKGEEREGVRQKVTIGKASLLRMWKSSYFLISILRKIEHSW